MSEEALTLDQTAPEAPASTEVETEVAATEDQDLEASSEAAPSDDEDLDELDYDGEKYRIPKKLKPGFMMQADYTRKTQEVAQTRQELEAQKQRIAEQAKAVEEINEDTERLALAKHNLKQFEAINWQQLENEDPFKAQTLWRQYSQWKDFKAVTEGRLSDNKAKRSEAATSERTTRIQEVIAEVTKIPGWNAEVDTKVQKYAHSIGLTDKQIEDGVVSLGAPFVKALHKAFQADQFIQKQQQAAKPDPVNPEPVKPLATVTKAKPAPVKAGLHDGLSTEEWVKQRTQQLSSRR
jgi:hypothetical protein